ncbi:hypothetical protein V8F20_004872 [Naviculisporaceae sp. PSN 640]
MAEGVSVTAPTPTENHKKRRRDVDDHGQVSHSAGIPRIPQPPPPQSGNEKPINYLCKPNATNKLRLFQSENEAFSDIVSLINDYEGVLSRHESLAAKLGAKLTSPRLLRAMESLFEGSIAVTPLNHFTDTPGPAWCAPGWLEIIDYATSNPRDFNLTSTSDGRRVCQFNMNNLLVEIGEDDWRLIMSGAPDRFRPVPSQPPEQDEEAELATIEILEKRLATLIKEADDVARRARRLTYHLSGRKAAISSRRSLPTQNHSAPQYPPSNQQRPSPSSGLNPAYDLHADLLQQFLAPTTYQQNGRVVSQPPAGPPISDVSRAPTIPSTITTSQAHILTPNSRRSPAYSAGSPTRREGTAPISTTEESQLPHRSRIQSHVDELAKGDRITPPCDRCRRLNVECIKNLTSCQGCTKRHAKCAWKSVTDDEIDTLLRGGEPPPVIDQPLREEGGERGDVDTDVDTPEAVRGKESPPSSASSSTRGQQSQQPQQLK